MSRLVFQEKGHKYLLDGKPLTGVTTILGVIAKPQLLPWAAKMATEYTLEEAIKLQALTEGVLGIEIEALKVILDQAKTAYAKKRDKAADIGTAAHKWVERWIKGENPERDPELAIMTDNFIKWTNENKVEFVASEKTVFSEKDWFAGTFDFACKIGGKLYLGDLKTSSGIYPEMFYQTSAYQYALQEMEPDMWPFDGHVIVNITKKGELNVEYSYMYPENLKAFMGALAIYRRGQESAK